MERKGFIDRIMEYGRRFALMQKGEKPNYLMPVKFLEGKTDMEAYAPRENIRIKINGGGLNFVHGGASLQEMVVPIIEYQFLRNASNTRGIKKNMIQSRWN